MLLKFLHETFYNSQFQKHNCNFMHSFARKTWVNIFSYYIRLPCTRYSFIGIYTLPKNVIIIKIYHFFTLGFSKSFMICVSRYHFKLLHGLIYDLKASLFKTYLETRNKYLKNTPKYFHKTLHNHFILEFLSIMICFNHATRALSGHDVVFINHCSSVSCQH